MEVTPSPLELHADTVTFDISATLPVGMLKKGKVYTIYPYYTYNGTEIALDGIEFVADDYTDQDVEPRITKSFSFAYSPEMQRGALEAEGEAKDPRNGKTLRTPARLPLAVGIITTSTRTSDPFGVGYAEHGYNNQEELIATAISFYFEQGRSQLRRSELRSNRGNDYDAFIAAKNITRTVTITGTHSPEGTERINSDLAEDRAAAIEAWYRKQMDKYDYEGMADSIEFILKPVVESWDLFKEKLAAYEGITADQKNAVLYILNKAGGDFESKEDELQELSFYKKLFNDIYPDLRRAKSEILTVKPKKTDAEIAILAKQIAGGSVSADTLSMEELMYAGTLTPSIQEKVDIYMAAVKKGDTWEAHNNLGAALLAQANRDGDMAKVEKAVTHLETAKSKAGNNSALPAANLGMAYYMQGNLEGAYETMTAAAGMSPSMDAQKIINSVKGVLEIKMAMYDQALTTFARVEATAANYTNKGLTQILLKDYAAGISSLDDALEEDSKYAMAYYLKAVASARLKNTENVISNLVKAFEADPELKEVASNDLEFVNLASNPDFTAIF